MKSFFSNQSLQGPDSLGLSRLLFDRGSRSPFLVVLGLMFVQQFSGVNSVVFYAQSIFAAAGSDMDPGISLISKFWCLLQS